MGLDLKSSERCDNCKMQLPLCICEEIPHLSLKTKLIMIIHSREIRKPTNTGRLAAQCLANSETHVRGLENQTIDDKNFLDPDRQSLVLFPSPGAQILSPQIVADYEKPINLIVPDGNWKQATRIPKREPKLIGLPCVILPEGPPSEYRLRREPRKPHGLATMEAVARAMKIIEGQEVYDQLMHVFRLMVERSLYAKGKLRLDEIYGGIPGNR